MIVPVRSNKICGTEMLVAIMDIKNGIKQHSNDVMISVTVRWQRTLTDVLNTDDNAPLETFWTQTSNNTTKISKSYSDKRSIH
jgi:hypothetical protein